MCSERSSAEGMGYVISFGIGAIVVLIFMWTLRFGYHFARGKSFVDAKNQLPGFALSSNVASRWISWIEKSKEREQSLPGFLVHVLQWQAFYF